MRSVNLFFAAALLVLVPQLGRAGPLVNGNFSDGFNGWTDHSTTADEIPVCFPYGNGYVLPQVSLSCLTYASFAASQQAPGVVQKSDHNGTETAQTAAFTGGLGPGAPITSPTGNASFAFISNEFGPGQPFGGGASLSQTFTASQTATDLTFNIDFVTQEALNSTFFTDAAGVALFDGATLVGEVDLAAGYNSYPQAPVLTPGGAAGGFNNSSGWIHEDFDFAGREGDTLTLDFYVENTTDTLGESRLLIDNVSEVPEPPSDWIMLMGLLGFSMWRLAPRKERACA